MNRDLMSSLDIVLTLVPASRWRDFPLTQEEAFLLSLINGKLTVRVGNMVFTVEGDQPLGSATASMTSCAARGSRSQSRFITCHSASEIVT